VHGRVTARAAGALPQPEAALRRDRLDEDRRSLDAEVRQTQDVLQSQDVLPDRPDRRDHPSVRASDAWGAVHLRTGRPLPRGRVAGIRQVLPADVDQK